MDLTQTSHDSKIQSAQLNPANNNNHHDEEINLPKPTEPEFLSQTKATCNMMTIKQLFHQIASLFDTLSPSLNSDGLQEILKQLRSLEESYRNNLDLFKESSLKMMKYHQGNLNCFEKKQRQLRYDTWFCVLNNDLNEMNLVLDYKNSSLKEEVKLSTIVGNKDSNLSQAVYNSANSSEKEEDPCGLSENKKDLVTSENEEDLFDKNVRYHSTVEKLLSPLSNSSYEYDVKKDIVKKKADLAKSNVGQKTNNVDVSSCKTSPKKESNNVSKKPIFSKDSKVKFRNKSAGKKKKIINKKQVVNPQLSSCEQMSKQKSSRKSLLDEFSLHTPPISPDVSSFLDCSLSLNDTELTSMKPLEETQSSTKLLELKHLTEQTLSIMQEECKAEISQDRFKMFDLEELCSTSEFNNNSSPHSPFESPNQNLVFEDEKNIDTNKYKHTLHQKTLVDQITSAMVEFSSPTYQHNPINNIGGHFLTEPEASIFSENNKIDLGEGNIASSSVNRNWIGCPMCGQLYENQEELRHHLNLLHTPKVCTICNFTPMGMTNYQTHVDQSHNLYKLCHHCEALVKEELFDVHVKTHTKQALACFKCSICSKAFENEEKCKTHEKSRHANMTYYQCTHCEHLSSSRFEEAEHKAGHLAPRLKKNLCKVCYAYFDNEDKILAHMKSRHLMNDNTFPTKITCIICYLEFDDGQSLINHIKNYHKDSNLVVKSNNGDETGVLKHKCPYCSVYLKTPKILAVHIIVFHKVAPFMCNCKEKFFTKGLLDVHILKHSKIEEIKFQLGQLKRGRKKRKLSECDP